MPSVFLRVTKVMKIDYDGPRTAKGLTDFAKKNIENRVIRLTDDTLASFLLEQVFLDPVKSQN